jgi:hypothetical protein
MPCDRIFKRNQTITQRKAEIVTVIETVSQGLARGRIKAKISPKGGIVFDGLTVAERDDVSDACVYRAIMRNGSALARHMIAKAEAQAGRSVDKTVLAGGHHSHDGGATWSDGH